MSGRGSALAVDGLRVRHGLVEAVHGVSLEVRPGEIVTVIGPNGAGKSTLLSAIAGLLPWEGELRYDDQSLRGVETEALVARGLCLVPETRALFGGLSVEDNLRLGAYWRRRDPAVAEDLAGVYALFPRLAERARQVASTLSGGERQMVAIGRALMGRPRLLMLDEPSLGLAPKIVSEIFATLGRLRGTGVSVLLVEQNARAALALADRAYVLETGEIRLEGPAAALASDPRVVESYLGLGVPAPSSQSRSPSERSSP
jgi:branched-chain amino acid transport system ATP-binding protein